MNLGHVSGQFGHSGDSLSGRGLASVENKRLKGGTP